ncbi:MAG TPA: ATP-binding protein [Puia sp.]|jgi:signal transduction histidine kinase|nr:ATP-binding protein [Puia sp.]
MNKDLQSILNIIQRSQHLTDEEKNTLSKAANSADKELEIESSLERVGTVAMSMKKRDDMLHICQVISTQLELLNVKEIRNVQTAIFYEDKGTYMNYEYYAKHDKTFITETSYTNNKIHQEFADKMLKGYGEFMVAHIIGNEVKDWLAYQKTTNVFIDDYLNTASSLNYYWFSLGPVALGISTYSPLNEEETNLFKRFLKVFELSYRRYLDIEKAEAQARESQIQLALEKVRARTMAMQKSEELAETASLLFKQLLGLGIKSTQMRTCAITTLKSDQPIGECWITKPDGDVIPHSFMVPYNETSAYKTIYAAWKNGEKFLVVNLSGDALVQHLNFLKKYAKIPTQQFQALPDQPTETFTHAMFFSQGYLFVISNEPLPEYHDIFKRFGAIFQQTYTRFLDLKNAEAQARESQIQLALERVRARTMAMQKSDELSETVFILFQQFKELGKNPDQATIGIINEEEWVIEYWVTMYGNQMNRVFKFSIDEPNVTNRIYKAWKEQKKSLVIDLSGKELYDFATYRASLGGAKYNEAEKRRVINVAFFSKGLLNIQSNESRSAESILLLERFAKVFEQTYTRFLDLQKAETQAREATIEAALERVRFHTMAMNNSNDVGVATIAMFSELEKLELKNIRVGIAIFGTNQLAEVWSFMKTEDGKTVRTSGTLDMNATHVWQQFYKGWQQKQDFFHYFLAGEEKKAYYKVLSNSPNYSLSGKMPELPDQHFQAYFFPEGAIWTYSLNLHSEEHKQILKKFTAVFSLTFRRYQDLKKAEAQARESQIELSLERVRAKTMAMHNSQDVGDTVATLFEEFVKLGISTNRCGILIHSDSPITEVWTAKSNDSGKATLIIGQLDTEIHPMLRGVREAWKNKESFFSYELKGEGIKTYYRAINDAKYYPTKFDLSALPSKEFHSDFYFAEGCIFAFTAEPISAEASVIFKRFAGVFGQTYRRYLDLQKAEAQARESQIQLALERVRARTMAMQKSDELSETVFILFQQFKQLGENPDQATIGIINEEEWVIEYWVTMYGNQTNSVFKFPIDEPNVTNRIYNAWKEQKKSLVIELGGIELYDFANFRESMGGAAHNPEEKKSVINVAFFSKGLINVQSNESRSAESILLLERFALVFEQTYTRFLDLQKAEAQARESQIEAALERVRSRSMAMQKSEELKEVIKIVYDQFIHLNINIDHAGFVVDYKLKSDWHFWIADKNDIPSKITHPYFESVWANQFNEAKEKGSIIFATNLNFEEKNKFYKELLSYVPGLPEESKKFYLSCPGLAASTVLFEDVSLYIENFSGISYSDEENKILLRFGKVFQQTYTRFLDLQKAEAQARESQIEAALERVRSKAMSMQKSEDLSNAVAIVFDELEKMDLGAIRCGISIINKENHTTRIWSTTKTTEGTAVQVSGYESMDIHPLLQGAFNAWSQLKDFSYVLKDDDLTNFYTALSNTNFKLPDDQNDLSKSEQYMYVSHFPVGGLYVFKGSDFSDDIKKVIKRFGEVFNLTYTRYNDLQIAEASTKEAIRQAALDRIRADIASMRTTQDLERITPLVWNELSILNVPFIRCGVFIMNDEQQLIHTFLSTPDGKAIAAFHIPYDTPGNIELVIRHWKNHKNYIDHWDEDAFTTFAVTLVKQGALVSPEQYLQTIPHGGFYLHFLPFLQGMLYVGNPIQLSEEEINLIQSIADAFSTAYARYEDFNKLEAAKQQVDKTLVDLKQAQQQLVQSEKMASLGELTAGIAHEIQNPLNFVNNFSEVSNELIEELQEERNKAQGTRDEKMENEILNDIKQNLEKINHHGKRADAIVKGMLQHSRSSAGEKESADINALADEYLRLSYQGLRAKDKAFNSAIKTDFDTSIGKINIVPADIGRVLLNLYNNAFYVVNERRKVEGSGYEPTVTVTTRLIQPPSGGRAVEIKVIDNGGGIPQKVIDKIFQPFFTTKPTGQGTGLGLSLSYDIIKAHGGEIKVETKEGEGTKFIIQLPFV